jgi:hypothetical protein
VRVEQCRGRERVSFRLRWVVSSAANNNVKTRVTVAEVAGKGWLSIHAPAPSGTAPGKLDVVVIWPPPAPATGARIRPHAGTLPGKVQLAADFHAPVEDFRAYME